MTQEEMSVKITELEARSKSNTHRIDTMEKRQDDLEDLVTSVRVLATRMETMENTVDEIKADVKTLADKPAKRWDSLVEKVILTAVGLLVGAVLGGLIP